MGVVGEAGCGGDHGLEAHGIGWGEDFVGTMVNLPGEEFALAEGEQEIPFD